MGCVTRWKKSMPHTGTAPSGPGKSRAIRLFHSCLKPDPEPPDDHADKRPGAQPECKDIGFAHCAVTCLNLGGEYVSITLTFSFTACAGSTTLPTSSFFHRFRIGDTPNFSVNNRRALVASFSVSVQHRQTEMIATTAWCAARFLAGPICGG